MTFNSLQQQAAVSRRRQEQHPAPGYSSSCQQWQPAKATISSSRNIKILIKQTMNV